MCVKPWSTTDASAGAVAPGAFGYSMTSITRSLPSGTPMIAAFTTTGDGTSSPMSRSMSAPSIRYGGDSTVSPSTSRYHATAASTSATQSAVCASPVIIASITRLLA